MAPDPDDPLAALRRSPSSAGIFTDFDGTLSPIVEDPATAVPVEGAPLLLGELAERFAVVAVVSGRPVSYLAPHLPPSVLVVGLYGLEVQRNGTLVLNAEAERWRPVIDAAANRCEASVAPGVVVERKGLSMTLHYRKVPEHEPDVVALAETVAAETGLVSRPAKQSVELHPPIEVHKGTTIRALAEGLSAVCYLGDDLGDMSAFHALDLLAATGVDTVKMAVRSEEAPPGLLDAADLIVDGPSGAANLLRSLLASLAA